MLLTDVTRNTRILLSDNFCEGRLHFDVVYLWIYRGILPFFFKKEDRQIMSRKYVVNILNSVYMLGNEDKLTVERETCEILVPLPSYMMNSEKN